MLLLLACKSPITVLTYNAGLAVGFVPGSNDRAEGTVAAALAEQADVTCLQEVWLPEHRALVTGDNVLVPEPAQVLGDEPACPEGELDSMTACLDENCSDTACADELVDCVFASCVFPFLALESTCQGCVMANVGGDDISVVTDACEAADTAYAYGGSFGTALVTQGEMLETDHLVLDSTTNRRGVQYALIETPMGQVDVFCTHLTAIFDLIPYPRDEGDWETEQRDQIDVLRGWVDEKSTTDTVVLMGDFNNGPDEFPSHYRALSAGYDSGYEGDCTYCEANPLNSEDSEDRVIDHVFTRGFDGTATGTRVLDQAVDVTACGETFEGAPSDHYGVSVLLEP